MFRTTSCLTGDNDDDCIITVRHVGSILYLCWLSAALAPAPHLLQVYLRRLAVCKDNDSDKQRLYQSTLNDLVKPFEFLMNELAPPSKIGPFSLHDYLHPPWFQLKAIITDDLQAVKAVHDIDSPCLFGRPGTRFDPRWVAKLNLGDWKPKICSSRELQLPVDIKRHPLLTEPAKVTIEEQTDCFFKPFSWNFDELVALGGINNATANRSLPADTRICRLYGFVVDTFGPERPEERLMGVLLNYIPTKQHRTGRLGSLQSVAYEKSSSAKLLQRWMQEVEESVGALHRAGCVWGDAKPENVFIDEEDHAWVIDFGGGYTEGWVDKEHEGTKEGDLIALEKMKKWIHEREERLGPGEIS